MEPTSPANVTVARYPGARVHRAEDPCSLTGHGTVVNGVARPGIPRAGVVRGPVARAHIRRVDRSEALTLDGARAVFTARELNPDVRERWYPISPRVTPGRDGQACRGGAVATPTTRSARLTVATKCPT